MKKGNHCIFDAFVCGKTCSSLAFPPFPPPPVRKLTLVGVEEKRGEGGGGTLPFSLLLLPLGSLFLARGRGGRGRGRRRKRVAWHCFGRTVDGRGEGFDNPSMFCMKLDQLKKYAKEYFSAIKKLANPFALTLLLFPCCVPLPSSVYQSPPHPFSPYLNALSQPQR